MVIPLPRDGYLRHVEGFDPSHASGWCIAGPFLRSAQTGDATRARPILAVDREARTATLYDGRDTPAAAFAPLSWSDVCAALEARCVPRVSIVPAPGRGRRRRRSAGPDAPPSPPPPVPPVAEAALTVGQALALEDLRALDVRARLEVIDLALREARAS